MGETGEGFNPAMRFATENPKKQSCGNICHMKTFTATEAREKFATVLEQATKYGEVRIKRRDGQVFVIKPQKRKGSPLAVNGIKLKLSRYEILQSIEEGRRTF